MILNLQYWGGDKTQAMDLARLIADLEEGFRNEHTFLFTSRFDCSHDQRTIEYVSKKFKTRQIRTTRNATGWPNGPNQMAGESYKWCCDAARAGQILDPHNCVLMMEADCVPLKKGWIDAIVKEFIDSGKLVSGAWLESGGSGIGHINGNMVMSFFFIRKCPMIFFPPARGGWDVVLAQHIAPHGNPSKLIWSDYRLGTPDNEWKGCEYLWESKRYESIKNPLHGEELNPVWFHGCKDPRGLVCARERLLK